MRVLVIDTEVGNLRSVVTALGALGITAEIIASGQQLHRASCQTLIFPGVGEARSAMKSIARRGIDDALRRFVARGGTLLGICVGAQLLLEHSEESATVGLGIVRGANRRLSTRAADGSRLKVPHMGWNTVWTRRGAPLFAGIPQQSAFYFVHSYYTAPLSRGEQIAWCEYGEPFPVAFARGRVYGVQFHPEKSGQWGLQLLRNFARHGQEHHAQDPHKQTPHKQTHHAQEHHKQTPHKQTPHGHPPPCS